MRRARAAVLLAAVVMLGHPSRAAASPADAPSAQALAATARSLLAEGRTGEAITRYREAAALAPRDASVWIELAEAHRTAGNVPDAIAVPVP